jgi:hypothetical protein
MKLQICRRRFSFDGAGTVGFSFSPAVWQGKTNCSSTFLKNPVGCV